MPTRKHFLHRFDHRRGAANVEFAIGRPVGQNGVHDLVYVSTISVPSIGAVGGRIGNRGMAFRPASKQRIFVPEPRNAYVPRPAPSVEDRNPAVRQITRTDGAARYPQERRQDRTAGEADHLERGSRDETGIAVPPLQDDLTAVRHTGEEPSRGPPPRPRPHHGGPPAVTVPYGQQQLSPT